jgi:uncharacterized damage-inducible protein DinB
MRGDEVRLPLYATVLHLVNHHTDHRGQVITLLRQLGKEPEPSDLYRFYIEERVLEESLGVEEVEEFGSPVSGGAREEEED